LTSALARCVGEVDTFLSRHWSRRPLLRAGADPAAFADLFSLDDVDAHVSSSLLRLPAFRLVRDGTPLDTARYTRTTRVGGQPVAGVADPGRVWKEFADGASIVLQALHKSWAPLTRFCRSLELELTHPVQANAYVTPPVSRGLAVHHDTHDVLVLHLAGAKQWSVYEPAVPLPLPSQRWKASYRPGPLVLEAELGPGDCLYIPRGFPHAAAAGTGVAAHLTIGILTWTWRDVVAAVLARLEGDVRFRQGLRPGFAADADFSCEVDELLVRLREWVTALDPGPVAAEMARRFWARRPPILAGQLAQLEAAERLGDGSVVRRRAGAVCHLEVRDRWLRVTLGDRVLRLPAPLEPAVRTLASGQPVSVGALAGTLDDKSRLVLARRLVREGLLEVVVAEGGSDPGPPVRGSGPGSPRPEP
jgi:hypothetical protein